VVAPKDKESLPVKQLAPVSPERAEVSPGGSATNGPVSGGEGGVGVK